MKKKLLIELFIYAFIVIISFIVLFTYKPKQKPIDIPSDFKIVRSEGSCFCQLEDGSPAILVKIKLIIKFS